MAISTLQDILISSLRAIGVLAEGQEISASQINDAMDAMNLVLDELSDAIIYATTSEDFDLIPGQDAYTIGPGGDFDTVRPIAIENQCYVRDSSQGNPVDYSLTKISQAAYNSIDVKYVQGIPEIFYYDTQYPLGIITFYYIPDKAYLFHCVSNKDIAEITDLTAALVLPPVFKSFLKWNTGKVLAADYPGISETHNYNRIVLPMARRSMTMIQRINSANKVEEAMLDVPKPTRALQDWRGPFNAGRTY